MREVRDIKYGGGVRNVVLLQVVVQTSARCPEQWNRTAVRHIVEHM